MDTNAKKYLRCAGVLAVLAMAGEVYPLSHQEAYDAFRKGADFYAEGKNGEAIRYLEKSLLLDPRLDEAKGMLIVALAEEALLQYEDNQYEKALPVLNKLMKLLPDDAELQKIYEKARAQYQQKEEHITVERAALDIKDQYQLDWMGYVGMGKDSERLDERIRYLKNIYALYAGTIVDLSHLELEIQTLIEERKSRIYAMSHEEKMTRAHELYQQERYGEAVEIWEHLYALKIDDDIKYYLSEGRMALTTKQESEIKKAHALKKEGMWGQAISCYKTVLLLDSSNSTAQVGIKEIHADLTRLFNKGLTQYQAEKYNEAVAQWQHIADLYPGYRSIEAYIGQVNAKIKESEDAVKQSLVHAHIKNGDNLHRQGRVIEAIQIWKKALSLDPKNVTASRKIKQSLDSLYAVAQKSQKEGKAKHALEIWELIVSIDPGYRDVKKMLVRESTKRSINIPSLLSSAEEYYASGDYTNAFSSLQKILKVDPQNRKAVSLATESALAQGIVLYRSDKLKEAIEQWNYVLRYQPAHEKAIKYKQRAELKLKMLEKME